MKRWLLIAFIALVVGVGIFLVIRFFPRGSDMIRVDTPKADETVTSPLTVSGAARGHWYFEADFPVKLYDGAGSLLAAVPAQAQGDWMTEEFVPFTATLTFDPPQTGTGTLVLEKDNPSGLPEYAASVRIPVTFASTSAAMRQVTLYYYNPELDMDASGNILCSRAGLTPVTREIPVTQTPIQDAVNLLLRGGLTDAERARGITTEFPLEGVSLTGAALRDGTLTLSFDDPNHKTSGGSCRAGILWFQIEATAKQFPGVTDVRFQPDTLFQP